MGIQLLNQWCKSRGPVPGGGGEGRVRRRKWLWQLIPNWWGFPLHKGSSPAPLAAVQVIIALPTTKGLISYLKGSASILWCPGGSQIPLMSSMATSCFPAKTRPLQKASTASQVRNKPLSNSPSVLSLPPSLPLSSHMNTYLVSNSPVGIWEPLVYGFSDCA